MSGEAEPSLGSQPEAFPTIGGWTIGRNRACGLGGLDEAGPTRKCSRVLDRSDELALMGINSSSSVPYFWSPTGGLIKRTAPENTFFGDGHLYRTVSRRNRLSGMLPLREPHLLYIYKDGPLS